MSSWAWLGTQCPNKKICSMKTFSYRYPLNIILRKNQLWLSELLGFVFVLSLLSALMVISIEIFINEATIRKNNNALTRLYRDQISLSDSLSNLRKKNSILTSINEFVNGRLPSSTVNHLTELVYQNSRTYGYDPDLLLAVIHVESVFDRDALGRYRNGNFSGALGLMQLKFETAQDVARDLNIPLKSRNDLFIPEINIALGVAYLTRLIALFKDLKLGILAYNQGPGTVMESLAGKRSLSIKYYNKVLKSYFNLKKTAVKEEDPTK